MAFFRRINCHFCGVRSPHNRGSGISQFQCASCEAWNYLDDKGNIVDTPAAGLPRQGHYEADTTPAFQTLTRSRPETLANQQEQAFCNTCLRNQQIYVETLSNYLPDESDPEYQRYEDALPEFRRNLEERYPQVCRKCAADAQMKINRADYYAATKNMSKLAERTRKRGPLAFRGQRDDWYKWSMRQLLDTIGWVAFGSLLLQSAWHAYGILATIADNTMAMDDDAAVDFAFDVTQRDCVSRSILMHFDRSCYSVFAAFVPRSLIVSACLLWYNPGLKDWYHHTYRMQAITGQTEHFRMQLILLVVRAAAYFKLSDTAVTAQLSSQQLLVAHGFVILFLATIGWVCRRTVRAERWKMHYNMMPKPEERDVLGAFAGPATEQYERQASSIPPQELFNRDRVAPFPIANLAPKQSTYQLAIPSPPPSDETGDEDEGDVMDIDPKPAPQKHMPGTSFERDRRPPLNSRSLYNYGSTQGPSWSGVRDELFGIQNNMALQAERQRREEQGVKLRYEPDIQRSPFRGRLPPAPTSMERKLRNPVTQVSFKKAEPSKQRDFLQQMRDGIAAGKTFSKQNLQTQRTESHRQNEFDEEELSPAKARTRGQLDLKPSSWMLPTDSAQATGLEDLFGGNSFRIADEPAIASAAAAERKMRDDSQKMTAVFVIAVPVALLAIAWNIKAARHALCMWLVDRIEALGY